MLPRQWANLLHKHEVQLFQGTPKVGLISWIKRLQCFFGNFLCPSSQAVPRQKPTAEEILKKKKKSRERCLNHLSDETDLKNTKNQQQDSYEIISEHQILLKRPTLNRLTSLHSSPPSEETFRDKQRKRREWHWGIHWKTVKCMNSRTHQRGSDRKAQAT